MIRWIHPQVVMSKFEYPFLSGDVEVVVEQGHHALDHLEHPEHDHHDAGEDGQADGGVIGRAVVEPSASRCVAAMGFSLRGSAPYIARSSSGGITCWV